MHRDEIHLGQQILHPIDQFHLQTPCLPSRKIRIISHHSHSKGDCPSRHLSPDPTHSQNSQRLSIQLRSLKTFSVPLTGRHRGMSLGQMPRQPQKKGESLLRRADRVSCRSIHHHHAFFGGRIHIHIVHTYSSSTHRSHRRTALENSFADLRLAAHHQRIATLQLFEKFLFLERRTFNHLDLRTRL